MTSLALALPIRRTYLRRTLAAAAVGAAVACACCAGRDATAMATYLMGGGAYVPSEGGRPAVLSLVSASLPTATLCYLLSGFVSSELARDSSAVLVRARSRAAWSTARLVQVALLCLAFRLLVSAADCLALLCLGRGGDPGGLARAALLSLAPECLATFSLVLAETLVALDADEVTASVSVLGVHFGTLFACSWAPVEVARAVVPWLPSTQGVLAWHDVAGLGLWGPTGVEGFGIAWSVCYLTALAAILWCLVARATRRRDVL